jgi:HTH-type transcriptional regulator/antitoxin HigA
MNSWFVLETHADYERAVARYEKIRQAPDKSDEFRERQLLVLLISDYEKRMWDLEKLDPIDLINIRLKEFGMQASDLARIYGDKGTISKVLNRKQKLSLTMIRKFSKLLGVPAEALMKEYDLRGR